MEMYHHDFIYSPGWALASSHEDVGKGKVHPRTGHEGPEGD